MKGEMSEGSISEESNPERKKNREESKMGLGFGPYDDWDYEEVLPRNPR